MRIQVNDYGAYAFPFELSVELANRGHQVFHTYCDSLDATPNGCFVDPNDCPSTLTIVPLRLGETLQKQSIIKRRRQDVEYGGLVADSVDRFSPEVVISGNTLLDAQRRLQKRCHQNKISFVFWLQDVISHAIEFGFKRKLGPLAIPLARFYRSRESSLMRASDHVVAITEDFAPLLRQFGVSPDRQTVIKNWAPLDQFPLVDRSNDWSQSRGLQERFTFVYSGTLSLKHNPILLADLARHVARHNAVVLLRSTGQGADYLRQVARDEKIDNLIVEGFGPFHETPQVFGSADVLIALLEPDASQFSVPSKVLSYLCAGRSLLLAVPEHNLAANIVRSNNAGLVCDPHDTESFLAAAGSLIEGRAKYTRMGQQARNYAEATFGIGTIASRFVEVFEKATEQRERGAVG